MNPTLEGSDEWTIELWKTLPQLIVRFDDEWIVDWIQQNGLDEVDQTLASALNRLRLDTENTQAEWKEVTNRIYLTDLQSRLWPYMESHLGAWQGAVKIQPSHRAFTDGIDIFLPAFIEGETAFGWQAYRVWVARFVCIV